MSTQRFATFFCALLSLLFAACLPAWGQNTHRTGELLLLEESHNFGAAEQGETVHHTFILKNIGTNVLTITRIVPDCCAAISLSRDSLNPGETACLEVTLETHDREGLFLQTIYIHTDSLKNSMDYVRLFGIVEKPSSP